ncbi:hypothetical protein TRFO_37044 [Tritrichomonas foetus]|uniref:Wntless-like transmembrane domain-containing protein n=1 Tax=Tritrichomonas foetus TaxID=1144522 RepID=A0A1J4JGY1_9EUKA|nr:hypothetical protein TRFO_37044 [Tritrichomonas foetus]|eukprot:OHS96733.1 hypothetical protein TRFO_37044 [Tritrichomonas foetus]
MLSLDFNSPLHEIDISNTQEDDIILSSDYPIPFVSQLKFIIPFLFVFLYSFFLPDLFATQTITKTLSKSSWYFINNSVSDLAPVHQNIKLLFRLKGTESRFNGTANILCYREDKMLHNFDRNISMRNSNDSIFVFSDQLLNYDRLFASFNFSLENPAISPENITTEMDVITMLTSSSLITSFFRIALSSGLLCFALTSFINNFNKSRYYDSGPNQKSNKQTPLKNKLNKNNRKDYSQINAVTCLEQKITFALVFFVIIGIDPLFSYNVISASEINLIFMVFARDLLLSYLSFYILALFSTFTRDPLENRLLSLAIPYVFMSIPIFVFWINDAEIYLQDKIHAIPELISTDPNIKYFPNFQSELNQELPFSSEKVSCFTSMHLIYYIICFITIVVRIIMTKLSLKPEHKSRWTFYTITTLSLLLMIGIFVFLKLFSDKVDDTGFEEVCLNVIFTFYAAAMCYGHQYADFEQIEYYSKHDEEKTTQTVDDITLDVEEDPEQIKNIEKKRKNLEEVNNSLPSDSQNPETK